MANKKLKFLSNLIVACVGLAFFFGAPMLDESSQSYRALLIGDKDLTVSDYQDDYSLFPYIKQFSNPSAFQKIIQFSEPEIYILTDTSCELSCQTSCAETYTQQCEASCEAFSCTGDCTGNCLSSCDFACDYSCEDQCADAEDQRSCIISCSSEKETCQSAETSCFSSCQSSQVSCTSSCDSKVSACKNNISSCVTDLQATKVCETPCVAGCVGLHAAAYVADISPSTPSAQITVGFLAAPLTDFSYFQNPFSDVTPNTQAGKAALEMYRRKVILGESGQFNGTQFVSRLEAQKILSLLRYQDLSHINLNLPAEESLQTITLPVFLEDMVSILELKGAPSMSVLFPERNLTRQTQLTRYDIASALYAYLLNR